MRSDPPEELLGQLRQAGEAVLFCHVAPDGDTLGSARALELLLNALGWRTAMVVDGEVPARLRFLPGLVLHRPEEWGMPENAAAIAVDVSSPDRLGKAEALYNAAARRWVIDHHGTNPGFGHINWVEGSAPATAILVNRLYRALGVPLVIARRSSKVYEGSAVNINYVSGSDHHIETMSLSRRAVNEGQRALIVDDFLKGGGTAKGMIDLMAEFDVEVVGTAFVMSTENPNQRCIRNEKALMTMNVTNDPASLTVRPAPWLRELAGEGAVCAEQEGTN